MDFYAPLFGKIVDSSLWLEDDLVVKVFLTMLAKKDMDDIVRASAFTIGSWAKKTEAQALEALKVLSSPDTKRLEPQPYEGRRIEKVEGGWLVLNGDFYRKLAQEANRREYQRRQQAKYRSKKAAGDVAPLIGDAEASLKDLNDNVESGKFMPPRPAPKPGQEPPPGDATPWEGMI